MIFDGQGKRSLSLNQLADGLDVIADSPRVRALHNYDKLDIVVAIELHIAVTVRFGKRRLHLSKRLRIDSLKCFVVGIRCVSLSVLETICLQELHLSLRTFLKSHTNSAGKKERC